MLFGVASSLTARMVIVGRTAVSSEAWPATPLMLPLRPTKTTPG
jgi:hypothetical protein